MADFPSRLDLFAIGRGYVVERNTKIDPAQVDVVGSDVNVFVGSQSHVAYAIVLQLAYAVNRLLLDGAEGEDLDRYAWDRYQLTRKGASPARVPVRVYRPTFTAGPGVVPAGTKILSLGGFEYITVTTITFGATDLSVLGTARATQAGKATQVGANQLRKLPTIGSLWDKTLKVNNDAPAAGGEDVEDDDTFRSRIRNFWNTARRGTLGAIEFGALTVPGVVSAQAIESLTTSGDPARVINLYIADSSGVASDALCDLVRLALLNYRAAGIAVLVYNSIPQIVDIALNLAFQAGTDTITLTDQIRAAIVDYVNSIPVNATLTTAALVTVLQRFTSAGLVVTQTSIAAPVGDIVPLVGRTIRTTLTNVTA